MKTISEDPLDATEAEIQIGSLQQEMDSYILNSILEHRGKAVHVFLTSSHVCWYPQSLGESYSTLARNALQAVSLKEVLAITYESASEESTKSGREHNEIELFPSNDFALHVIKRCKNHKWKMKKLLFQCSESHLCQKWYEGTRTILNGLKRPKHLLIFVNPVGGRRQARKVYREKIGPLFDLAGIRQDVIVTEKANHAREYLESEDMKDFDGVIVVGGDGMFSEILNGLISRHNNSFEGNSSTFIPRKPEMPLGIIPADFQSILDCFIPNFKLKYEDSDNIKADGLDVDTDPLKAKEASIKLVSRKFGYHGSTDTICYCTTGINDPVTSALHIIIGDRLPIDICSVWNQSGLLKYSVSLMGYGFFGDVIRESERLRWMGPRRYDLVGFRKFMANRSYEGELTYLSAPPDEVDPREKKRCRAWCRKCSTSSSIETDSSNGSKSTWQTVRGRFISVIGANITCRCAKSLDGLSPNAHLGDGYMDLILIRETSRGQYLRHMLSLAHRGDPFGFDFVEVFRVKEFNFRPAIRGSEQDEHHQRIDRSEGDLIGQDAPDSVSVNSRSRNQVSAWNVDGELVEEPNIHVKVHRQLITLFARGIEDSEETPTCRPCRKKSTEDYTQ